MLSILCPINPSAHLHNHSQPDCNVHCKELHLCAKTRGLGALQSPGLVDLPTQLLSILDFYLLSWRWRPQWLWNNLLLQARTSRTQFQASFTSGFVPSMHLNRTEEEEWSILVVPCRALQGLHLPDIVSTWCRVCRCHILNILRVLVKMHDWFKPLCSSLIFFSV